MEYEKRLEKLPPEYRDAVVNLTIEALQRTEPAILENIFTRVETHKKGIIA